MLFVVFFCNIYDYIHTLFMLCSVSTLTAPTFVFFHCVLFLLNILALTLSCFHGALCIGKYPNLARLLSSSRITLDSRSLKGHLNVNDIVKCAALGKKNVHAFSSAIYHGDFTNGL